MAAMVRRHWAWALSIPILILTIVLAVFQHDAGTHKLRADVTQETTASPVNPDMEQAQDMEQVQADAINYLQVQQLRRELALTQEDLAALGVSSQGTKDVIGAVKNFVATSASALREADISVAQARENLQEAARSINVGPIGDDASSIPSPEQLQQLQQSVADAKSQRDNVLSTLVGQIGSHFTPDQQVMWGAARTVVSSAGQRMGVVPPGPYRYVAGLTDTQVQQLDHIVRQSGIKGVIDAGAQMLNASQLGQLQAARQNQQTGVAMVASAETQALPLPIALQHKPSVQAARPSSAGLSPAPK